MSREEVALRSMGIIGGHWGSLGTCTAGIAGMAPPHLFVGFCPGIWGVGAGMAVAFLDCIPKPLARDIPKAPHGAFAAISQLHGGVGFVSLPRLL